MNKIINKIKVVFYVVLIFIFNINIIKAEEISEWEFKKQPTGVSINNRDIVLNLFKIVDVLFVVCLSFFVIILSKYFLYIRKEEEKKIKLRKILSKFFILLSFLLIVKIIIFFISQSCCP